MKFKCKKRSKKSLDINYMPLHVIYIITAENWKKNLYFWEKMAILYIVGRQKDIFGQKKENAISEIAKRYVEVLVSEVKGMP